MNCCDCVNYRELKEEERICNNCYYYDREFGSRGEKFPSGYCHNGSVIKTRISSCTESTYVDLKVAESHYCTQFRLYEIRTKSEIE